MNPSRAYTRRVPSVTGAGAGRPATLAEAVSQDGGGVAKRVVVRNLENPDVPMVLSTEVGDLTPEITAETFRLPGGESDVFVLAPGQTLFGRMPGAAAGRASVTVSDAFPVVVSS